MKINEDLKAYTDGSFEKAIITVLTNPNFHSVCIYRMANFFCKIHLSVISKILWYINRVVFNVDIDYRAQLSGGLHIVHGLGIVIGKDVITKGKCTIYQGVTLGGAGKTIFKDGHEYTQPVIGDNVVIYTNAMVFGPVFVEDNIKIKAGSIVAEDIKNNG